VNEALHEALELVRPMAEQCNVRLSKYAEDDEPRYVIADKQRMKQVLLNLLSNAVKYNREMGRVTAIVESGPPERVRISVIDTGMGIPDDQLNRVFEPFDRLGAEQGNIEGTGLGLALSRSIAELMGGSIGVHSVLGDGSTFWLELPTADSPTEDAHPALPESSRDPQPAGPSRTVLCIEDNIASIKLLERVLEHRPKVRLLAASQGSLGVDLARLHHPDLIFLDLNLPDIHGIDVLEQLHTDEQTAAIPVVVLSADATPGQIQRLMDAGARDYLTKPINVANCLALVDTVFATSSTGGRPRG
jgi:CheY-like chemotaxis protein/anti-sigma regulatory factor (Ser/Thr protein kinase)